MHIQNEINFNNIKKLYRNEEEWDNVVLQLKSMER